MIVKKSLEHDLVHKQHQQAKEKSKQHTAHPSTTSSLQSNGQAFFGIAQEACYGGGGTLLGAAIGAALVARFRSRKYRRNLDAIVALESEDGVNRLAQYLHHRNKG
jgi:hypothetical protein